MKVSKIFPSSRTNNWDIAFTNNPPVSKFLISKLRLSPKSHQLSIPSQDPSPILQNVLDLRSGYYHTLEHLQRHSNLAPDSDFKNINTIAQHHRKHEEWLARCPNAERRAYMNHEFKEFKL